MLLQTHLLKRRSSSKLHKRKIGATVSSVKQKKKNLHFQNIKSTKREYKRKGRGKDKKENKLKSLKKTAKKKY